MVVLQAIRWDDLSPAYANYTIALQAIGGRFTPGLLAGLVSQ